MPKLSYFLKFSGLLIFKCRPFKSSTTVMERWKKWDGIVENANGIIFYDVLPRVEEAIKNVGPKVSHFLVNEHKICKKKFSITKQNNIFLTVLSRSEQFLKQNTIDFLKIELTIFRYVVLFCHTSPLQYATLQKTSPPLMFVGMCLLSVSQIVH